jgi:hypothetical protein
MMTLLAFFWLATSSISIGRAKAGAVARAKMDARPISLGVRRLIFWVSCGANMSVLGIFIMTSHSGAQASDQPQAQKKLQIELFAQRQLLSPVRI